MTLALDKTTGDKDIIYLIIEAETMYTNFPLQLKVYLLYYNAMTRTFDD